MSNRDVPPFARYARPFREDALPFAHSCNSARGKSGSGRHLSNDPGFILRAMKMIWTYMRASVAQQRELKRGEDERRLKIFPKFSYEQLCAFDPFIFKIRKCKLGSRGDFLSHGETRRGLISLI